VTTRFDFLRGSGGLVLLASANACVVAGAAEAGAEVTSFSPSAWLEVTPADRVRVFVSKSEMGQGIATGCVTIVADELDARLDQIDVVFPPADESFDDPVYHMSITGGSTSAKNMYPALRHAGAVAKAMLASAAARRWGVDAARCAVHDGAVAGPDGKTATFGMLAADASRERVPRTVALKDPSAFRYIGKHVPRVDIPEKVDGRARFGIDVRLPGMLYATIVHPPAFGSTLVRLDDSAARKVAGVRDVFAISSGVAVVATNTWAAFSGARQLALTWGDAPDPKLDSHMLYADASQFARGRNTKVAKQTGDPWVRGARTVTASYSGPFLAHAAMEPTNATALIENGTCTVWVPTQIQSVARSVAAATAGVPVERVALHTTYLGGAFGRHLHADNVREACEIAKRLPGVPVKMTSTREEDIQHDFYRPMAHSEIRGTLDDGGRLIALDQTVAMASSMRRAMREYMVGKMDKEKMRALRAGYTIARDLYLRGIDSEAMSGLRDLPYGVPNLRLSYADHEHAIPVGHMRAPQANWNTFVIESFLDECALAAGRDPLGFRRELLASSPRASRVLERVVAISGFGAPAARGRALGLAIGPWEGSLSAVVVEASMREKAPRVERIWVAADIGRAINPDNAVAQLEGGALFGLSMAYAGKITIKDGRVEQSNFHDYVVTRMADAPRVEVSLVESDAAPSGVGELGVCGVAPALGNALFALTGTRCRTLPFADAFGSA
jgi:isoquinoline 1-oxidoreductase beta subunit